MNTIQILNATPADAEGILDVREKTWVVTYPNDEYDITVEDIRSQDFKSPECLERWRKSLTGDSLTSRGWVAKDNSTIIGFCIAGHNDDGSGEIKAMYVLPEYQGRGAGKQLIEAVIDWLGTGKQIIVNVAKYNTAAIEFYKKFGFEVWRDIEAGEASKLPSGKIIPEIQMLRKIEIH